MKKIAVTILFISASFSVCGQVAPDWLDVGFRRIKFPENNYFTGFAYGEVSSGRTLQEVTQQIITDAQADLSRKIRMQITSRMHSEISAVGSGGQYREKESFSNIAETESSAEVVGVKTESYYDTRTRIVYAFASVNRHELIGYHKGNLNMNLFQSEGLLKTAKDLEAAGEKAKARQQCEAARPLLVRVRTTQDLLTAISPGISSKDLQQARTETLHNQLLQMQAQLAQAVLVYMVSVETNFSNSVTVVGNRLKSLLSAKGCSFVDDSTHADFLLKIEATTRHYGNERGFTVCYADVAVSLFDVRKEKVVFQDEFSQKGIRTSLETAGRKALEDASPVIANKISHWIEN